MKTKIIIYREDTLGGTGTLSIRMGGYLVSLGYEVIYICHVYNDTNNVDSMLHAGIKVIKCAKDKVKTNLKTLYSNDKFSVLTYSLNEFLFMESLKGTINIVKNTMYVVGYRELQKGKDFPSILRKITKAFYYKIIKRMFNSDSLVFLDRLTFDIVSNYYNFSIKDGSKYIFYLPIEIKSFNEDMILDKLKNRDFTILTIARANFPFKGYMMKLIDDFAELFKLYPNIKLTMICYGEDSKKLVKKVSQLSNDLREKIQLITELVPYENLKNYFFKSKLYIGMGTTIIDAVNEGVPSISVKPHVYENLASGFFNEQPENLGVYEDKIVPTIILIEKAINLDNDEYISLCKIQHKKLAENYNIELMSEYLISNCECKCKKNIKSTEIYINVFLNSVRNLVRKIKGNK